MEYICSFDILFSEVPVHIVAHFLLGGLHFLTDFGNSLYILNTSLLSTI